MAEDYNTNDRLDSSSPSSSMPPNGQKKKRTRASKPKVRTGCITCKIRRVKCGEEKPACLRCTSTGRTCDGYDKTAVSPRYQPGGGGADLNQSSSSPSMLHGGGMGSHINSNSSSNRSSAELAKVEFVKACQGSEALRSMRPLAPAADMDGAETERRLFHQIRTAAAAGGIGGGGGGGGGLAEHMCTFAGFWSCMSTPDIQQQDDAVKHAVVAVGAAYQLFRNHTFQEPIPDGFTRDGLDVFIIQQYNLSMSKLQRHVSSSSTASVQITLLCCLAFICLESLRANHAVAVTHLVNGLKILESLPSSAFEFLAHDDEGNRPSSSPKSPSTFSMADIIHLFGRLEVSACFFTRGIRPVVAERGYSFRLLDDGSSQGARHFSSLSSLTSAIQLFQRDAMARLHEIATTTNPLFWADPREQQQQACLRSRGTRLGARVDAALPVLLPPVPDTPDLLCTYLDLLFFRCAQIFVFQTPPSSPSTATTTTTINNIEKINIDMLHRDILRLASIIIHASPVAQTLRRSSSTTTTTPAGRRISLLDTGLLGPLYTIAVQTDDPRLRLAAIQLMGEATSSGDNIVERKIARVVFDAANGNTTNSFNNVNNHHQFMMNDEYNDYDDYDYEDDNNNKDLLWPSQEIPRALTGLGCVPRVYDVLVDDPDDVEMDG